MKENDLTSSEIALLDQAVANGKQADTLEDLLQRVYDATYSKPRCSRYYLIREMIEKSGVLTDE